tara:strand:+ start:83 stop:433 length:351 start_codon:yes stop_codon:yes gene_type:complete
MTENKKIYNSDTALREAKSVFLDPFNLDDKDLSFMLATLLSSGGEMGDIYFQAISHESWTLEDSEVKNSVHSNRQGVGFRSIRVKSQDLLTVKFLKKSHFYRQPKLQVLLQLIKIK